MTTLGTDATDVTPAVECGTPGHDVDALAAVIEAAIEALPMERRLYPDVYAATVAAAVHAHLHHA